MFKKLKKDFIKLNMLTIALLMFSVFAIIYVYVYQNTMSSIKAKVNGITPNSYEIQIRQQSDNFMYDTLLPTDYTLSFNMKLDSNQNIEKIYTYLDMPYETYESAKETVLKKDKRYGSMRLHNKTWFYELNTKETVVLTLNGLQKMNISDSISFIDMSESKQLLNNIRMSFLIVGSLMLIAIYYISEKFASKAVDGIEDSWMRQKQFIADASHELKTPLAIIKTNLAVLELDQDDNAWLENIHNETNRMQVLIQDLLLLAQSEDVSDVYELKTFNLSDLVSRNRLIFEPLVYEKNLKLQSDIEEDIELMSDESKIDQIIKIIFDNAIKYTTENGSIHYSLKKQNKAIVIEIENDSESLSQEDLNQVFDRFYRKDSARTGISNSYGLGLAIAKMISENLNSEIKMTSSDNKTKVTLTFHP